MTLYAGEKEPDTKCLVIDQLKLYSSADYVEGYDRWVFKARNICNRRTQKIYIRVAFYDFTGYRHGFSYFTIDSLDPNEKCKIDQKLPNKDLYHVKVVNINTDRDEMLNWIGRDEN